MGWVRIDDHFDEHPKLAQVGPLGWAVWVAGLAYANRNQTDGFIPWAVAHNLVNWEFLEPADEEGRRRRSHVSVSSGMVGEDVTSSRVVDMLVAAGLWEELDDGYSIHDYADYQPTRAQLEEVREERRKAGRRGANARWDADDKPLPIKEADKPIATVVASEKQTDSNADGKSHGKTMAKVCPVPNPNPNPNIRTTDLEILPGTLGSKDERAAFADAPTSAAARRNGQPKNRSPGRSFQPLADAFLASGEPFPEVIGSEVTAAQTLLGHFPASDIAECWHDVRINDHYDEFDRKKLSFGYLARDNRLGNWQRWRDAGKPGKEPGRGATRRDPAPANAGQLSGLAKWSQ